MTGDTPPRPVTWLALMALLTPLVLAGLAFLGQTYGELKQAEWRIEQHSALPWHGPADVRYRQQDSAAAAQERRIAVLEEQVRWLMEQRKERR